MKPTECLVDKQTNQYVVLKYISTSSAVSRTTTRGRMFAETTDDILSNAAKGTFDD